MSEQQQKKQEKADLHTLVSTVLTDVRWILVGIAGIFGLGFAAYGQVQTLAKTEAQRESHAIVDKLDASVKSTGDRLEAHILDSKLVHDRVVRVAEGAAEESRATRKEVEGLREDLRRIFPALPPVQRDGGVSQ